MKSIVLILCAALTISSCKKSCEKNIPGGCNLVDLSNEYIPVCGCDEKTYTNAGHAMCVGGVTYTEGECK